jgi:hypothetical protein
MTGYEAGEHEFRAGARRLVPTHLPRWVSADDATAEVGELVAGPVDLAVAGALRTSDCHSSSMVYTTALRWERERSTHGKDVFRVSTNSFVSTPFT